MTRTSFSSISLALSLSLAGCASQVDGTHQGDVLAAFDGTVANERTQLVPSSEVSLVWLVDGPAGDSAEVTSVPIVGSFPAAFHLAIYTPPDDAALNMLPDGSAIGVAYVVAATEGADLSDPEAAEDDLLGMDEAHVVVYLSHDAPAGSEVAAFLHGPQTAGFHIYAGYRLTDIERADREACEATLPEDVGIVEHYTTCGGSSSFDDLLPVPATTPLDVRLVDEFSTLEPINWK